MKKILYATYIITADGRPLVWQVFQSPEHLPPDGLLSPLLSTIQGVSSDLTRQDGAAEKITLSGITYHMKWLNDFFIVLVTNTDEKPKEVLNIIGWKFMGTFKDEIKSWDGNMNKFEGFLDTLHDVLEKNFVIDATSSINPTKKLDTRALFNLDKELKNTALAIFSLKSATAEEVAKESGESLVQVQKNLTAIRQMGYLGSKDDGDDIIYFY